MPWKTFAARTWWTNPLINGSRFDILNRDGVIAQHLSVDMVYDDGAGNIGNGWGYRPNGSLNNGRRGPAP